MTSEEAIVKVRVTNAAQVMAEIFLGRHLRIGGKLTVKVRNGPTVTFGWKAVKHRKHASEKS